MASLIYSWSPILLADELFVEADETGDIGYVADEAERDAHGAVAFPVDSHPEIVNGQMGLLLRSAEAGGELGTGQAEGDPTAPRVTETTGAQRNVRRARPR